MTSDAISLEVANSGLCVCPNFLSPEALNDTRNDLENIKASGKFIQAGVGKNPVSQLQEFRRDKTHWLDEQDANPTQSLLWEKLNSLKTALNRNLFLGINSIEGHYAAYPSGGFYRRHRDCFRHENSRVISLVLYLNKNWQTGDGGALRVHKNDVHVDINPIGGTMVCFFSREAEHEVLESHAPRLSFTSWFKVRS